MPFAPICSPWKVVDSILKGNVLVCHLLLNLSRVMAMYIMGWLSVARLSVARLSDLLPIATAAQQAMSKTMSIMLNLLKLCTYEQIDLMAIFANLGAIYL